MDEVIIGWEIKLQIVDLVRGCVNFEAEISRLLRDEDGMREGEDKAEKTCLEKGKRLVVFPGFEEGGGYVVLGGDAGDC